MGQVKARDRMGYTMWIGSGPSSLLQYIKDPLYVSGYKTVLNMRRVNQSLPNIQLTHTSIHTNSIDLREYDLLPVEAPRNINVQENIFVNNGSYYIITDA